MPLPDHFVLCQYAGEYPACGLCDCAEPHGLCDQSGMYCRAARKVAECLPLSARRQDEHTREKLRAEMEDEREWNAEKAIEEGAKT